MNFNRFLIFRYVTAIFFFTNLYWLVMAATTSTVGWIVPLVLMVGASIVMVEQVSKYWRPSHRLAWTKRYYWAQLGLNVGLISTILLGHRQFAYAFMTAQSEPWLMGCLGLGMIVSGLMLRRVYVIEHDQDRYLQQIKKFAASL